jgi:hypothetical protein
MLNHAAVGKVLDRYGLPHTDCQGSYKEDGQDVASVETSHMVHVTTDQAFNVVKNLFFVGYNQDAILVVYSGFARLELRDGTCQQLGEWREVTAAVATASDCYTLINGRYFQALETAPTWGECSQATKDAESEALHDADKPQFNQDQSYSDPAGPCSMPFEGRRTK